MRNHPLALAALLATAALPASSPGDAGPAESVAPDARPPEGAGYASLAKKAGDLFDAFSNSGALLTRDGKRVVFVSARDGLPQVYVADPGKPAVPARRLFAWPERVALDATTPDGKAILVRSDRGADENWSIYRAGLDGRAPVELTPGDKLQRDPALVAEGAPDRMWFSARRMSEAASAVYQASAVSAGAARRVYRDEKPGFLTSVSSDGRLGLFVRYPSRSENYLLRLDLGSGEARLLYPREGKVAIHEAELSRDGKVAYVATDGGGEQALLLALDARTGAELGRYVEKDVPFASVAGLAVAGRGGGVAFALDAGNRSELRLLDARRLAIRARVRMPLGAGTVTRFSEDGRRLIATWSTPSRPGDAWAIDARTGEAAPLLDEPRQTLAALPQMEASIAAVQAHDGLSLPVNVFLPARRPGKLPVIVSYHGGPAGNSKVRWSPFTAFFVGEGYAWVEPNVRGSDGFGRAFEEADNGPKRLDAFRDVERVGRWAASQPWADADRTIVFGGSYGGYTVLVGLTRMPDLWRAGVDVFGVANLSTFMATTSGLIREVFLLEFGDPEKDAAFLDSISPLRAVDRISAPLFVYAGANDPRVPRSESDLVVRALRERKVPVEYMVAQNEGHSLARRENVVEFLARAATFLERHAGPRQPLPR